MAAAVSVIYSSDGESWFHYFSNYLQRVFSDINVESIQDTNLHQVTIPNSKVRNAVVKSKVNIFIVSPGYIQFLIANSELTIRDVLRNRKQTVIFLCGTTLDDFNLEDSRGQKIADRFPPFSERCLLSYPRHDEMLEKVVELLDPDPRSSRDETATSGGKGESESGTPKSPQHKLNTKRKRKSKSFKFMPNNVHCEVSWNTEGLIEQLVDWLINYLIEWVIFEWLIQQLIDCLYSLLRIKILPGTI